MASKNASLTKANLEKTYDRLWEETVEDGDDPSIVIQLLADVYGITVDEAYDILCW